MCVFRKNCKNFIPSPYNDVACALFCRNNPNVAMPDYAPDLYVKGRPKQLVILEKKELETETKKGTLEELAELEETDKLIKEMAKLQESQEGELVRGVEDTIGTIEEQESTVRQIMNRRKKSKRELKERELKEAERIVEEHTEVEEYNEKKKEEEELKKKIKEIKKEMNQGIEVCPYCGKKFKNLNAHLRYCERGKADDYKLIKDKKEKTETEKIKE